MKSKSSRDTTLTAARHNTTTKGKKEEEKENRRRRRRKNHSALQEIRCHCLQLVTYSWKLSLLEIKLDASNATFIPAKTNIPPPNKEPTRDSSHPASSTSLLPAATSESNPFTAPQLAPPVVISSVTPAGFSVTQYSATLMPSVARAALAAWCWGCFKCALTLTVGGGRGFNCEALGIDAVLIQWWSGDGCLCRYTLACWQACLRVQARGGRGAGKVVPTSPLSNE